MKLPKNLRFSGWSAAGAFGAADGRALGQTPRAFAVSAVHAAGNGAKPYAAVIGMKEGFIALLL